MNEDIEQYWNDRAPSYETEQNAQMRSEQGWKWTVFFVDFLARFFPERTTIAALEVGCGTGTFSVLLAELGCEVTAVDGAQNMLDATQKRADHHGVTLRLNKTDAQRLPFADATFDLLVSRNVSWNLLQPEAAYREWLRILRPGGHLLNFDANWYLWLFDEHNQNIYRQTRKQLRQEGRTDPLAPSARNKKMEKIAQHLPLSRVHRPHWDRAFLSTLEKTPHIDETFYMRVWNEDEICAYRSSPLFCVHVPND